MEQVAREMLPNIQLSAGYVTMNHENVRRHMKPFSGFQNITLRGLTAGVIRDWMTWAAANGRTARSVNTTLQSMRIAVRYAVANKDANLQDAEVLAQILAIEISNTGIYAVLPRTTTMQAALIELEYQIQGYTAEEGAKALGQAINAEFVLSAEARSLGNMNMFAAQILHVEDGSLLAGNVRDYHVIDDGMEFYK